MNLGAGPGGPAGGWTLARKGYPLTRLSPRGKGHTEEVIALLGLLDLGVRQGALEALDEKADAANLLSYVARAFDLARRALRGGIYSGDVGRDRG